MATQKRSIGNVTGATTAAAALTTVIFYVISAVWGADVPGEVQGAVTTLLVVIAGYLVPPKDDGVAGTGLYDDVGR